MPHSVATRPAAREVPAVTTTFLGRLPKQFLLWTFVCSASAAPSFVLGAALLRDREHILAMLAGVATFIVAFTCAGATATAVRLRRRPLLRRSLYAGYGLRLALSLLFGLSMLLQFPLFIVMEASGGVISTLITGLKDSGSPQPVRAYFTTIVHGVLWNVALAVFMAGVYGLLIFFRGRSADRPQDGLCRVCGYDLRASPHTCPECGTIAPVVGAS